MNLCAFTQMCTNKPSRYQYIRPLGTGITAVVSEYLDTKKEIHVAIKTFNGVSGNNTCEHYFTKEKSVLERLDHHGIPKVLGSFKKNDEWRLVLTLGAKALSVDLRTEYAYRDIRNIMLGVGQALLHAHSRGIVHRDVKLENICYDPVTGETLLIDWAFAVDMNAGETPPASGSPVYVPPEVIESTGLQYDGPENDMWSLGVVLYIMLVHTYPYDAETVPEVLEKIRTFDILYTSDIPAPLAVLLKRIFVPYRNRITLQEFLDEMDKQG